MLDFYKPYLRDDVSCLLEVGAARRGQLRLGEELIDQSNTDVVPPAPIKKSGRGEAPINGEYCSTKQNNHDLEERGKRKTKTSKAALACQETTGQYDDRRRFV